VALLKEINLLKEQVALCTDEGAKSAINSRIGALQLKYDLLSELYRKHR
jgi:hypothetical protein